ncbi:MAG: response regulator [Pyrinomonadaceae bacterium]
MDNLNNLNREEGDDRTRILIVDDEASIISLMTDMLEDEPIEITSATTGYEALIKAQTANPDLIFLDLKLAGQINGLQVLQRLREHEDTNSIPVLLISGHGEFAKQGFEMGADGFIDKPFLKHDLLAAIDDKLGILSSSR